MNILERTLRAAFRPGPRRNPILDYLNESVSVHDLERRQREIDAGKFRPRSYPF